MWLEQRGVPLTVLNGLENFEPLVPAGGVESLQALQLRQPLVAAVGNNDGHFDM